LVDNQMDRRVGGVSRIDKLEEIDELATAVAVLDQAVHLAAQQIDPRRQARRALALIFVITRETRMHARPRRQIG
jgi:hypothetical protein